MTDQKYSSEPIIDEFTDINVADCCYRLKDGQCGANWAKSDENKKLVTGRGYCGNNINCHYKQYKSLEIFVKEDLAPTTQRLQEENKMLKEQLKTVYKIQKWEIPPDNQITFLGKPLEYWLKLNYIFFEIEDICKNANKECDIQDSYFKRNNYSWKQHQLKGLICKFKQILKIIEDAKKRGFKE